ncbi:MAG: MobF family relaxase [Nocardioides sp.]
MSLHKLTAGSGYDYLTRQVAALDATDKGHTGLASYYTERGETPGIWVGSGMTGIDGLDAGDVVTADHMQNLFGAGHHPLATERTHQLDLRIGRPDQPSPTKADYQAVARLGAPYKVYDGDISTFRVEVATRLAALNHAQGLPGDWPVPAPERAKVRTQVAREFFTAEYGRAPADARELAATIAKHSRPKTTAVAGYDLTFSPVKSVSVLWAIADPTTAAVIERAHHAAVKDALEFLETRALFTRRGVNGVRQVDVRGLVATAFTHRDSRAGDPDLHTHVAVANKVQTLDGHWLAIDGRPLHKAVVSASETYNTALERHLIDTLGVRFEERPNPDTRKRPVREILGVTPALNTRFSKRRLNIEDHRTGLVAAFQATHGRPPTPVETIQLSQQATLETRDAKHETRTLAEQRAAWHREAVEVLGSTRRIKQMIHTALHPPQAAPPVRDAAWLASTADRILTTLEASRSTWQYWHVYAEAQRQVRGAEVPTDQVAEVVRALVAEVLGGSSVNLARPTDGITEPPALRRADGSSVYTPAGSALFTSSTILAAEQRLVEAAGYRDRPAVDDAAVELALLESVANGITLNPGQAALVREMAISGARLQLAIAPAGSGKTTAMRALATAWAASGGTLVGLAPSAAAADALRTQIDTHTDTLAKLTHTLTQAQQAGAPVPEWVAGIGPATLVVIDEAGMADTLALDAAVTYILGRGGSVRLVGDDQQLASIGAGGVLRDIGATHGALQLTELVRYADPAEGAATLALRDGKPEALGFYLDRGRIHVGDLATMTEAVFDAWLTDRTAGLDSIMLAPTRDLVAELNRQARAHRLTTHPPQDGVVRRLGDGNDASVGDLIITRENDRRLRTSATDWVKNGDRWIILDIGDGGDLTVQHTQHRRIVRLPASYVQAAVELGYACTIHTAQGVTADTMHGLATGSESRQQLYTMLTRAIHANHLYLQTVGDGDPHTVIHPTLIQPLTPTDMLRQTLARDDAPQSATSLLRDHTDPALRLGEAAGRYLDALYGAAEHTLHRDHPHLLDHLENAADQVVPGLTDEPAWPTLRAHLLLLAANRVDPVDALRAAAGERELDTAHDRAATLDWRLDDTGHRNTGTGPLPWIPAIPTPLAADPEWGDYLTARHQLVEQLTDQVRDHATTQAADQGALPAWADNGTRPDPDTLADIEVWRAAMQIPATDRRPTGPPAQQKAAATWQRRLNNRLAGDHTPALTEWAELLHTLAPHTRRDDFTPLLAERLAAISRAGINAHHLLHAATGAGPLPDEHAAAALWWRMARHLTPAVAAQAGDPTHHGHLTTWTTQLTELLGPDRTNRLHTSSWWPALAANIDHALQRGWQLADLLGTTTSPAAVDVGIDVDECQALVWRTSIALDPIPHEHPHPEPEDLDGPPPDAWAGVEPHPHDAVVDHPDQWPPPLDTGHEPEPDEHHEPAPPDHHPHPYPQDDVDYDAQVEADLTRAGVLRDLGPTPAEPTEADLRHWYQQERQWDTSPVTRARMVEVNNLTQAFFEARYGDSWDRDYLTSRLGADLTGHEHFRPGYAPAGWTTLLGHLRRHGVTDTEMLATGVVSQARTGRLIDRFRDRVTFPVIHHGELLGFIGRRHPDLTDDHAHAGPKYLNTADTPLFHKGAQLFGVIDSVIEDGAIPVIVEGPMDAIAVTLASAGLYIGVTPSGTALTDEQATQLTATGRHPIVATDADLAGQTAAERDYWILTPHGLDPGYARFPTDLDPADILTQHGPLALTRALAANTPLGEHLLDERLDNLPPDQAQPAALRVLAARPRYAWNPGINRITRRLDLTQKQARRALRDTIRAWDNNPRKAAQTELHNSNDVRARLETAATKPPVERWAPLAHELDPRLPEQGDWPATAAMLQQGHDQGHDIRGIMQAVVAAAPLGERPAQDLRYRLIPRLDTDKSGNQPATSSRDDHGPRRPEYVRAQPNRPGPPRTGSNSHAAAAGGSQPTPQRRVLRTSQRKGGRPR